MTTALLLEVPGDVGFPLCAHDFYQETDTGIYVHHSHMTHTGLEHNRYLP